MTSTRPGRSMNMSESERWTSLMGGGILALYGLRRRDPAGFLIALLGAGVAWEGAQGRSVLNELLGIHRFAGVRSKANAIRGSSVRVQQTITVRRPINEVYRFWRNFENMPRFMEHLVAVEPSGPNRYRWVAKAPLGTVEWEAEVIEEAAPWLISWRSIPGSQIRNAGSVRFGIAPHSRGTEIQVNLAYKPPAGALGALVARIFGEEPSVQVREDLLRFKRIMESGEVTAAAMQLEGARQ